MSDDPADIYITRDAFDQGELHGRLVCAIFVNQPDFVEVTVHPDDGGAVVPTPVPWGEPPSAGISESAAIEAARDELPEPDGWEILSAQAGPIGRVNPAWNMSEAADHVTADHWVWAIFVAKGDRGIFVFIDYVDGTVLGTLEAILN